MGWTRASSWTHLTRLLLRALTLSLARPQAPGLRALLRKLNSQFGSGCVVFYERFLNAMLTGSGCGCSRGQSGPLPRCASFLSERGRYPKGFPWPSSPSCVPLAPPRPPPGPFPPPLVPPSTTGVLLPQQPRPPVPVVLSWATQEDPALSATPTYPAPVNLARHPSFPAANRESLYHQCALITPWNFPIAMITRKAGAALAAG
jgi:hypothetical protein